MTTTTIEQLETKIARLKKLIRARPTDNDYLNHQIDLRECQHRLAQHKRNEELRKEHETTIETKISNRGGTT